jgi:4-hydroxy-3-polyprenylbenzoate decarboxylase
MKKIVIAMTGASGTIYGLRLLEELNERGHEVHFIISPTAKEIFEYENGYEIKEIYGLASKIYENDDFSCELASGSFVHDGMVIVPCSLKTLAGIANGYANNLITRAATCSLKEGRKLILVPRETPLDLVSLRNMVSVKEGGAVILPAMPAFYHKPTTIKELVDYIVGKILDQLGIEHSLFEKWGIE